MAESTTLTVRLSRELKESLDALAESTGRSEADLVAEAIAEYLDAKAWIAEEIEQAVREADQGGPFVDFDDVARWLRSWGKEDELEPPTPKR